MTQIMSEWALSAQNRCRLLLASLERLLFLTLHIHRSPIRRLPGILSRSRVVVPIPVSEIKAPKKMKPEVR